MPSPLYLCMHLRDFAAQALIRAQPEHGSRAVAVLSGVPPLERVFAIDEPARRLGLHRHEPCASRVLCGRAAAP